MDKNKIIEAATKLVAKGAYDKAIKEYRRILESDPKDVRVLQKMGELFQKKNDNEQAATYFTKVAESYSNDGFFLKAVALYKQVLKLNPGLVEVNLRLAELHQQLQLISEATSYYQVVAQQYEKSGNIRGSLDTYKKVIELDPENVSSRIKLGEMYGRSHLKAEAANEFSRAAEQLKRNGRMDEYQRVMDRLSALDGNNLALAREVAQKYLAEGDPKKAIAKLQQCFKADPRDEQTLVLLGDAFAAIGQASKTASVWRELIKIYQSQGRSAEANQLQARLQELEGGQAPASIGAKAAPQAASRPRPTSAAAAAAPQPAEAPAVPSSSPESLAKLLKETDVYVKYGLHHKALEHLGRIFAGDPENLDAHEKAYQIYVESGDEAQAAEQLLNVLRLCTRLGAVDRATPYLNTILQNDPDHPEVPTFVAVLGGQTATDSGGADPETLSEDAILVDAADEELVLSEASPELEVSSEDLALQATMEETAPEEEQVVIPFEGEADLSGPDEEALLPTVIVDHELGTDSVELAPGEIRATEGWELDGPVLSAEEVQPLVEQPATPEGDLQTSEQEMSAATEPGASESAAEECEEARFFLDQGLLEEAREILQTVLIAYPGYAPAQELLSALEQREATSAGDSEARQEHRDAFDLAAELASEMGELDQAMVAPAASDEFQYSVDEVFAEFKKGLAKLIRPEDVDTHYDLGIAYREMGLIEDAIGEFTTAREGCLGTKKEVDCWTMIALLQRTQGDLAGAVESYKSALSSEHAAGETQKALEFELGSTWEELGQSGKAVYHYARVAKLDPQYREAASLVSRLSLTTQAELDPLPATRHPASAANGRNGAHPTGGRPSPSGGSEESSDTSRAEATAPGNRRRARLS